jgi:predicted transcriptional regulator
VRRPRGTDRPRARGLATLRRGGALSDLLFLYECTTREVSQLREVADALGLSVQAASHTFRGLAQRGLAQATAGRYRPTVAGVDFLHGTLRDLGADVAERLERMHVVATTRALARGELSAGSPVVLAVEDGLLTARAGTDGASRGVARDAAHRGELVEVEQLAGIVPLQAASAELLTVPEAGIGDPATVRTLASALAQRRGTLLAAHGLEALHLASRAAPGRAIERFGIAGVVEEASRLGVRSTVVVLDRDAPRLLAQFDRSGAPRIDLVPLALRGGKRSAPR